jgi:hypothetical protein
LQSIDNTGSGWSIQCHAINNYIDEKFEKFNRFVLNNRFVF